MYSYEDRIRAATLHIEPGKRVAATIQQLGYPTLNSLKGRPLRVRAGSGLEECGCLHAEVHR